MKKIAEFKRSELSPLDVINTLKENSQVEQVTLEGYDIFGVLEGLLALPKLKKLNIEDGNFSSGEIMALGSLPLLSELTLKYESTITYLTLKGIEAFGKLKKLSIHNPSLTELNLHGFSWLKEITDSSIPELSFLDLSENRKLVTFDVGELNNFGRFRIFNCFNLDLPTFLAQNNPNDLIFERNWAGRQMLGFTGRGFSKQSKSFNDLINSLHDSDLTTEERIFFAQNLFLGISNKKNLDPIPFTKAQYLRALPLQNKLIQDQLRLQFSRISEQNFDEFQQEKVSIAILGKTQTKKTEIKQKAIELGFEYQTKINDETTHVIVGTNISKDFPDVESRILISEEIFTQHYNKIHTPYLLEMTNEEENSEHLENIQSLLLAMDSGSVELALEMMDSGGVPSEVYTDLLFVNKVGDTPKIRKKAKELLSANASQEFQNAVNDRNKFVASKGETKIIKLIEDLEKKSPNVDWERFAFLLFKKSNMGLRYIFEKSEDSYLKKEILTSLIKEASLDYFDTYGNDTRPYELGWAKVHRTGKKLPLEVFELTDLEELSIKDCRLVELPTEIKNLKRLKRLNCANNYFKSIPIEIGELTQLEYLNLSANELETFPTEVFALKNLKELRLNINRVGKYSEFLNVEIPAQAKKELPNCTIVMDERDF